MYVFAVTQLSHLVIDGALSLESIGRSIAVNPRPGARVRIESRVMPGRIVPPIGGVISSYYSSVDRPTLPYWKLGFADTTLRLLGSDDFPPEVKAQAAQELTIALVEGTLRSVIAERVPLAEIVRAHELVEHGVDGRVIVTIDDGA